MPFADHKGVRLHWDERGPLESAGVTPVSTIVLVMGHLYSSALWYPVIPELAKHHRVVWFDNQGTGDSGWRKTTTVAEMAGDALAVMDAAGVAKAHLFGVSMGGVLVLEMYRQAPGRVASLTVGCSGILTADKPRMPGWARIIYHTPRWLLKAMRRGKKGIASYGSAASPQAVEADLAVLDKDGYVVAGVLAQAAAVSAHVMTREEVAGWRVPTLVLHGEEDATVPIAYGEELAATLPGARFVRMAGAGHNFLVARLRETLEAVTAFVDAVDRAG